MRLFMKVVSEQAATLGYRQSHVFDQNGGTLGRSKSCDWVLPDETTTLSAKHAVVRFNGRGFLIEDTSTNGVYLNSVDAPLGRGNAAILSDGDILYLGHFVVEVAVDTRAGEVAPEPWASPAQSVRGLESPLAVPPAPSVAVSPPPVPSSGPLDALARLSEARPVVAPPSVRPAPQPAPIGFPSPSAPAVPPQSPLPIAPEAVPASAVLPPTASLFGLPEPVSVPRRSPPDDAALSGSVAPTPPRPAATGIPDDFFDALVVPAVPGAVAPAPSPLMPLPPPPHSAGPPVIPLDFDFANPGGANPILASPVAVPAAHAPSPVPAAPISPARIPAAPVPAAPVPAAPVPAAPIPAASDAAERQRGPLSADLAADLVALRLPSRETPAPAAVADPMELLRQRAARRPAPAERRPPDALMGLDAGMPPPLDASPMPTPVVAPPVTAVRPVQVPVAPPMPLPAAARVTQPEAADHFAPVWSALGLDPANLAPDEKARLADELARAITSLAEGLVVTLGARRMVKDTFRMDQTQLRAQGNNPFKFASSGTAALKHFFGRDKAGFLSIAEAIDEGFADIKSHELAAMMAAQTMIGTLLDDLSPRRIEEATPVQGLLSRKPDKARLWETFAEMHAQRAQSIASTTHTMFGAAFAQAYQHQVAQKQETKP